VRKHIRVIVKIRKQQLHQIAALTQRHPIQPPPTNKNRQPLNLRIFRLHGHDIVFKKVAHGLRVLDRGGGGAVLVEADVDEVEGAGCAGGEEGFEVGEGEVAGVVGDAGGAELDGAGVGLQVLLVDGRGLGGGEVGVAGGFRGAGGFGVSDGGELCGEYGTYAKIALVPPSISTGTAVFHSALLRSESTTRVGTKWKDSSSWVPRSQPPLDP